MTWHNVAGEIFQVLPALAVGVLFSLLAALFLFVGYRWGWYRGVKDRDQAQRDELAQVRFKQGVAEDRLDSERKIRKSFEVMVQQMVDSLAEHRAATPAAAREQLRAVRR